MGSEITTCRPKPPPLHLDLFFLLLLLLLFLLIFRRSFFLSCLGLTLPVPSNPLIAGIPSGPGLNPTGSMLMEKGTGSHQTFFKMAAMVAAARSSSPTDDLYLDDPGSGYYPEDDDDFNSGSGSGGGEEILEETVTVSRVYMEPKAAEPTKDATKFFSPRMEPGPEGRARDGTARKPVRTEASSAPSKGFSAGRGFRLPVPVTEDQQRNQITSTTEPPGSALEPVEVRTENLFQRTEVLAAVIAGGVIGFLFAIFLILLLVYRMRKKDEGSYDLGERKPSGAAYQKAPTKEFYA
ncbi:hypothetical protein CCH79_00017883 [Gambusia affinis]|uniref:Syndecan n=1 Tax=Gambusia affinis TaxID=33528 RepID=A0A315V1Y6_GAMAF|nr:hypothetical protein CCH79_00017883 [Gambusia affinis]